jgi:hypothetical protein
MRAVVAQFLAYINSVFSRDTAVDMSLDAIVTRAQEDIRSRLGVSADVITMEYIDQFGATHVVQITRNNSGLMFGPVFRVPVHPPAYHPPPVHVPPVHVPVEPIRPRLEPIKPELKEPIRPTSPEAQQAEAKLRQAQVEQIFKFQKVALVTTTAIVIASDGRHSAKALFSVQDQNVAIQCLSSAHAAVVRFLEYIRYLFAIDPVYRLDMSLETIVERARQDLRERQGLSGEAVTVQYIDQFGATHVVQIPRDDKGALFVLK